MKHITHFRLLKSLVCAGLLLLTSACEKDKADQEAVDKKEGYILLSVTPSGEGETSNYYAQTISNLDKSAKKDNKKATEVLSKSAAGVYYHDGNMYISTYTGNAQITKWESNQDGSKYIKTGSISTKALGSAGNILFKDKTTAFVGGNEGNALLIFNPETMKITGKIDFSKHSRKGEVTNIPAQGDKVVFTAATEMVIRDNQLFVATFLLKSFAPSYTPATLDAHLMMFDLNKVDVNSSDNSGAFVKWITDTRGFSLGAYNSGAGCNFMQLDEKGDLYVLAHNLWGLARSVSQKPTAVLRIRKGETEFDKDYYFDLEAVSGGAGNNVMNLEYTENGVMFAAAVDASAIDAKNPYSIYVDPIYQWYKFDLYAKTATKLDIGYTKGAVAGKTYFENGHIYIPFVDKKSSYVQKVNIQTLKAVKLFDTDGNPMIIKR